MSGRVWAVLSGKGGVGKTTLTWALGAHLARQGEDVVLIDLGAGMRGLDIALGLQSRIGFDLDDVLSGRCGLDKALVREKRTGVTLLAAKQIRTGEGDHAHAMRILLEVLRAQRDWVLMDAPTAFAPGFSAAAGMADASLLLSSPDDASLRGADRVISAVRELRRPVPQLVVTRLRADLLADGLQYAPDVCAQLLDVPLGGAVPEDESWMRAALASSPLPRDSAGAKAISALANRMRDPATPAAWRWVVESAEPETAGAGTDAGSATGGADMPRTAAPGPASPPPAQAMPEEAMPAQAPDDAKDIAGAGVPLAEGEAAADACAGQPTNAASASQPPRRRRTFKEWLFGK